MFFNFKPVSHFHSPFMFLFGANGELSGSQSGWRVYSPSPRANGSNDFVRPRESARGRTNRARRSAQLAVRARTARPNGVISRRVFAVGWIKLLGRHLGRAVTPIQSGRHEAPSSAADFACVSRRPVHASPGASSARTLLV